MKKDGSYYKVFTAYKKKSAFFPPRQAVNTPRPLALIKKCKNTLCLADFHLIPQKKTWHDKIEKAWQMGEKAAQDKLRTFVENKLSGYKEGRDYPDQAHTSQLAAPLHFGEISPVQVWQWTMQHGSLHAPDMDKEHFLSELIWREFSCYLLHHFPTLHCDNFNAKFNAFPWQYESKHLEAWQTGNTGYPIIDAGMRELWQTGSMHNRVRMIVASFLVKNLHIHWHRGRDWFWDCLVDADLANNSCSWQWVAGCGVDAAPYFRIFNPITQGEKWDKQGRYTRKFVPELHSLPDRFLFQPWAAPEKVLQSSAIILGKTYPKPIVDLQLSRNSALNAYQSL